MLTPEKQKIFNQIKSYNPDAKESNYTGKDMTVNRMLRILSKVRDGSNNSNKYKQKITKNNVIKYKPDSLNKDYETDESMESKTGKGLEYFEKGKTQRSFDVQEKEEDYDIWGDSSKTKKERLKVTDKNEYGTKFYGYRYYIEFDNGNHEYMSNSKKLYDSLEIGKTYLIQYQTTNKLIAPNTASIQVDMKNIKILEKIEEKASIDWNNYLTKEEVEQFLSKDDKIESAEDIIYSKAFLPRYRDLHNSLQAKYKNSWTKRELVQDLAQFYNFGHLITENKQKSFNKLEEVSRNELLAKTKGETITRYNKAAEYKGFSIVNIDTSSILTDNSVVITCRVGKYNDTLQLEDILYWIQMYAENKSSTKYQVNTKVVTGAIMDAVDGMDIKVDCECRGLAI